jgi:hypothetical protein
MGAFISRDAPIGECSSSRGVADDFFLRNDTDTLRGISKRRLGFALLRDLE